MISENIKKLRQKKKLTQKELAELLNVTAQAVSRWENGEVEPSIGTIVDMAKIFEVTTDCLLNGDIDLDITEETKQEDTQEIVEQKVEEAIPVEPKPIAEPVQQRPVLAVCEKCNKPIYDGNDIVRIDHYSRSGVKTIYCKACKKKIDDFEREQTIERAKDRRKKSFIWGPISAIAAVLIWLWLCSSGEFTKNEMVIGYICAALFFPFVSCLILNNNFIGGMVVGIAGWGFVKLPGLIFELSLDGIIWLITVKLAFWLLGLLLAFLTTILGVAIGLALSLFVYPFALRKSIKDPWDYNIW